MFANLSTNRPLLLDGAIGTELIRRGLVVGPGATEPPEVWNLHRADDVRAIHVAYVAAGSDALHTNTFGLAAPRLAAFGLAARQREIGYAAVSHARAAGSKIVLGSLGPTGERDVETIFADAARVLVEAGVDGIHLETFFEPTELKAAIAGVRSVAGALPVWASFTVMRGATGYETPHGQPFARMVEAGAGADALGLNCSLDAQRMVIAFEQLFNATKLPAIAQPQAKMSDKCAPGPSSQRPDWFASFVELMVKAGAAAVGGCCGTTPADISAVAVRLGRSTTPTQSPTGNTVEVSA